MNGHARGRTCPPACCPAAPRRSAGDTVRASSPTLAPGHVELPLQRRSVLGDPGVIRRRQRLRQVQLRLGVVAELELAEPELSGGSRGAGDPVGLLEQRQGARRLVLATQLHAFPNERLRLLRLPSPPTPATPKPAGRRGRDTDDRRRAQPSAVRPDRSRISSARLRDHLILWRLAFNQGGGHRCASELRGSYGRVASPPRRGRQIRSRRRCLGRRPAGANTPLRRGRPDGGRRHRAVSRRVPSPSVRFAATGSSPPPVPSRPGSFTTAGSLHGRLIDRRGLHRRGRERAWRCRLVGGLLGGLVAIGACFAGGFSLRAAPARAAHLPDRWRRRVAARPVHCDGPSPSPAACEPRALGGADQCVMRTNRTSPPSAPPAAAPIRRPENLRPEDRRRLFGPAAGEGQPGLGGQGRPVSAIRRFLTRSTSSGGDSVASPEVSSAGFGLEPQPIQHVHLRRQRPREGALHRRFCRDRRRRRRPTTGRRPYLFDRRAERPQRLGELGHRGEPRLWIGAHRPHHDLLELRRNARPPLARRHGLTGADRGEHLGETSPS